MLPLLLLRELPSTPLTTRLLSADLLSFCPSAFLTSVPGQIFNIFWPSAAAASNDRSGGYDCADSNCARSREGTYVVHLQRLRQSFRSCKGPAAPEKEYRGYSACATIIMPSYSTCSSSPRRRRLNRERSTPCEVTPTLLHRGSMSTSQIPRSLQIAPVSFESVLGLMVRVHIVKFHRSASFAMQASADRGTLLGDMCHRPLLAHRLSLYMYPIVSCSTGQCRVTVLLPVCGHAPARKKRSV